jgi:hypothetical protein
MSILTPSQTPNYRRLPSRLYGNTTKEQTNSQRTRCHLTASVRTRKWYRRAGCRLQSSQPRFAFYLPYHYHFTGGHRLGNGAFNTALAARSLSPSHNLPQRSLSPSAKGAPGQTSATVPPNSSQAVQGSRTAHSNLFQPEKIRIGLLGM